MPLAEPSARSGGVPYRFGLTLLAGLALAAGALLLLGHMHKPRAQQQAVHGLPRLNAAAENTPTPPSAVEAAPVRETPAEAPAPARPQLMAPAAAPAEQSAEEAQAAAERKAENTATAAAAEMLTRLHQTNKKPRSDDEEEDEAPTRADQELVIARRPAAPLKPAAQNPPARPVAPCARCLGMGLVPPAAPRIYIQMGKDPLPEASLALPWSHCPLCRAGQANTDLLLAENARLAGVARHNEEWDRVLGPGAVHAETHHLSLHTELPAAQAKAVARAIEDLTSHLQSTTRSTLLTSTRPDTFELLIFSGKKSYRRFIDVIARDFPGKNWDLSKRADGDSAGKVGFFSARLAVPTEDMAVFMTAGMLMARATGDKAPAWLMEGFSSYCENTIAGRNLCYSFQYGYNEVRFGSNWNAEIKTYAQQGKLKTWDKIFPLDMINIKALDYLTCYSMVSFFMKTDPQRFVRLVAEIRDGAESDKALEKVFGRRIPDLQRAWANWAMNQR